MVIQLISTYIINIHLLSTCEFSSCPPGILQDHDADESRTDASSEVPGRVRPIPLTNIVPTNIA